MIHHISMSARQPRRVADVLSELVGGFVIPAPPQFPADSYFVLTGDEHGTLVEVLPYGAEMRPDSEQVGFAPAEAASPYSAVHALISVELDAERVLEIGQREGWVTRACDRGPFSVIECWVENRFMVEVAPPAFARRYLDFFTNPAAIRRRWPGSCRKRRPRQSPPSTATFPPNTAGLSNFTLRPAFYLLRDFPHAFRVLPNVIALQDQRRRGSLLLRVA